MPITGFQKNELQCVIDAWTYGFNARDSVAISSLYATDAVLWGTLATEIITTNDGVKRYFEAVMSSPAPFKVSFGDQRMRACGDLLLSSGSYTLTFLHEGQEQPIDARFSMVFRKTGGQWLIVDHHSSVRPIAAPIG